MSISDRIRLKGERVLSDNYGTLKSTTFEWRRNDGAWQTMTRDVFDRGNAAAILPYNLARRTVVLVRQFRLPAYVNGYDDLLIEAAAGLLDDASPEDRIRAEAEEEIGYRLHDVHKVFEAFMSPGSVTEKSISSSPNTSPRCASVTAAASPMKARTSRCWSLPSTRPSR